MAQNPSKYYRIVRHHDHDGQVVCHDWARNYETGKWELVAAFTDRRKQDRREDYRVVREGR